MQITITPAYAISTSGQASDFVVGYDLIIADAPALTGSERQVAWASAIRDHAIRAWVDQNIARRLGVARTQNLTAEGREALSNIPAWVSEGLARFAGALAAQTEARAWIDANAGAAASVAGAEVINTILKA